MVSVDTKRLQRMDSVMDRVPAFLPRFGLINYLVNPAAVPALDPWDNF